MNPPQTLIFCVLPLAANEGQVAGLQGVPGRLPTVYRLPGESAKQLMRRALSMATAGPAFYVSPILKG